MIDAEGNRTLRYIDVDEDEVFDAGDTDATEYAWDHRNRLTSVSHFDTFALYTSDTSDQIVQYAYDYANRLVSREVDPDGTSGGGGLFETAYIYDGGQIAAQWRLTDGPVQFWLEMSHRYLWNPQAVDQLLADEHIHRDLVMDGLVLVKDEYVIDDLFWALTDNLNSVRDLAEYNAGTDETTIALHRVLDSFGNETDSTGAADCVFGYTGKLFDEATGLQNNWNRWYDATIGKWLSEDSIWDGANLTRYVGNAPLTHTDPLGLEMMLPGSVEENPNLPPYNNPGLPLPGNVKEQPNRPSLDGKFHDKWGTLIYKWRNPDGTFTYMTELGEVVKNNEGNFVPPGTKQFPPEPSTGALAFDAGTWFFGGPLIKGGVKAAGATVKVFWKAGKGADAALKVAKAAAPVAESTAQKYMKWKALSTTEKVFYELGQILTSKQAIKSLGVFGDDVASIVGKGQKLISQYGFRGYIEHFLIGIGEAIAGSARGSTTWSVNIWLGTGSTPAWHWLWPRAAGAISSAIGSFFSRIPTDNNKDLTKDKCP